MCACVCVCDSQPLKLMKIPEHARTETGYQVFTEKPRIQAKKTH